MDPSHSSPVPDGRGLASRAEPSSALRALGLSAGSILEQIRDAVIAIDESHRVIYWGGGARELYGIEPSEAVGRVLTDLQQYRWLEPEAERQAYEALDRDGRWQGYNIHVLRSGEERFVESTVTVLRDEAGARVGLLAVIRDETARHRAEQEREAAKVEQERSGRARQDSEARAKSILDSIHEGFFSVDARWRLTYLNPRAGQLLGIQVSDVLDRVIWDAFPGIVGTGFEAMYRRVAASSRPESRREYYPRTGRTYDVRAFPTGDGITVYFEDVTEEVARERRDALLARREATFRHTTSLLVWTRDAEGLVAEDSPSWRAFTGQTFDELRGWGWLDAVHPDDRPNARAAWSRAVAEKSVLEVEYRLRRHDGVYVWTLSRGAPVVDDQGRILEWVGSNIDITARVELIQRLAESRDTAERVRAMYETLFDAIPTGVAFFDLELRFRYVNTALTQINGVTREAHLGRTVLEVLPDQNLEVVTTMMRVRDEKVAVDAEVTGRTPASDEPRTWEVRYFPVYSGHDLIGIGATVKDITERVRTDKELARSERDARERAEELDAAMRAVPAAIWIARDRECRDIIGNPESYRLMRAAEGTNMSATAWEDAASGRAFAEYVNGAPAAPENLPMQVAARTGKPVVGAELTFVFHDGEVVHLTGNAAPLFAPNGEPRGGVAAFVDVTRTKQASEALERREAEIRELVDNLPELAWMAQPDGTIDFYNRRWYEYTGTTLEEMRGWGWEKVHDPAILPSVLERWKKTLTTGEPFEMEFPLRGADGVFRWFLTRINPLRDAEGRIVRWIGSNANIDEQRQLREESARAAKFAELFVAMLGHDLRNPLGAIMSGVFLLERLVGSNERAQRILLRLRNSGERMARMIDQILDFSRIRSGQGLPCEPRATDAAAIVSRARDEFVARGARVEVDVAGDTAVSWDEDRIAQVLSNLIGNAVEHSPEGSAVRARVDAHESSTIAIEVHNAGTIAPAVIPTIFEPFRQGRLEAGSSGLGLGLYITKEIVVRHGGRIDVASGEAGTTFRIELPRRSPCNNLAS